MQSFKLVADGKVKPLVETYKFEEVNEVLDKLRKGQVKGRAVLVFE